MARINRWLERVLEAWLIFLITALTLIVVAAVIARRGGGSFIWYDEVASIMLAWITYFGASLAALKRAHIGFDGLLLSLPLNVRLAAVWFGEFVVIAFFVLLAYSGWMLMQVLQGMNMISLPWVSLAFTQSVIPVSSLLFILCQVLSIPAYMRRVKEGVSHDDLEIENALRTNEGNAKP
ncbi:TRAP transporter small permease [Fulvimarina sp. 2208YS6-2-32]|uniref:TRAP transporter small permease protein n=1 Tax=Fulvimarina uroteuthidis TaxID=3098149 RepID=A0ABU5I0H3_9HYPH|nr:TRAP transporter small permease [Fulvimarina sp. 2208YS6-2-32]MDY8108887.1 TRAP transporter small permease [Fulvimarina sp. 2208YS6-2-32]